MTHKQDYDASRSAFIAQVARITGVSKRYVRMVIMGERTNEHVMNIYMLFHEANEKLLKKAAIMNVRDRKHTAA